MAAPYIYSPLADPRSIRLLQVQSLDRDTLDHTFRRAQEAKNQVPYEGTVPHPSELDEKTFHEIFEYVESTSVKGRLVVASLDNLPRSYKAVSYVWGNSTKPHKIWLDNSSYLEVTNSAMEILLWIALSEIDDYFWIDALCINQNNNEEKGHQVRLMYDVYSHAEEVIAWTGAPSDDSQLALEFAFALYREIERLIQEEIPLTTANITNIEGCYLPSQRWTALVKFLQRPFFHRVWIVQEMVAAKHISLMCGHSVIDWMALGLVIVTIRTTGIPASIELPGEESYGLFITCTLRYQFMCSGLFPPFSYVLSMCQFFQSTDPRDRIFALLNLSSDTNDDNLAPNYNQSTEAVFVNTTRHLLTKAIPLITLLSSAGIGHDRALKMLPSWVPDWSIVPPNMSFGILADSAVLLTSELYCYYACGKDFKLNTISSTCLDGVSISIKGRIIDAVKSHHNKRPSMKVQIGEETWGNATHYTNWLLSLCHIFPDTSVYPTGVPFFPNVLSHALVAGIDDQELELLKYSAVQPQFVEFFAFLFLASGTRAGIPKIIMDRVNEIDSAAPASAYEEHWTSSLTIKNEILKGTYKSFEEYDVRVQKGREFFATEMGYVGWGPLLMQDSDIICLIYGAKVPFLIRKRANGGYFMVGECYVHGLMHGEGMSMGLEEDIILH